MVNLFRRLRSVNASADPSLKLNDFIEARPKSHHKKDKYAGRIGLKVAKGEQTFLLMSTHVVTEAITARSRRNVLFGRRRERYEKLADNWNDHVEIWAGDEKVRLEIWISIQLFDQSDTDVPIGRQRREIIRYGSGYLSRRFQS